MPLTEGMARRLPSLQKARSTHGPTIGRNDLIVIPGPSVRRSLRIYRTFVYFSLSLSPSTPPLILYSRDMEYRAFLVVVSFFFFFQLSLVASIRFVERALVMCSI